MKTENQEGKHTPEQKRCIDCGKIIKGPDYFGACSECLTPSEIDDIETAKAHTKGDWLIDCRDVPSRKYFNSTNGSPVFVRIGKTKEMLIADVNHDFAMDQPSAEEFKANAILIMLAPKLLRLVASQSSELSKLREENERLNLYYAGVLRNALDGLSGSMDQVEFNLEKTTERLGEMQQLYKDLNSCFGSLAVIENKAQHSLTDKDAEIESLRKQRLELTDQLFQRNETIEAKDKGLDQLRFSLQCAATDANDLRESNRELVEYLKYLRPFLTKAGRDTGGIDALISKSKPTE